MKKIFLPLAMALGLMMATTACGGDKASDNKSGEKKDSTAAATAENKEAESEAAPIETGYHIPLTFTAENLTYFGGTKKLPLDTVIDPETDYSRTKIVFHLKSDGKYTYTESHESYNWRTRPNWGEGYFVEREGKWTVTYRTLGENTQKVYWLHNDSYIGGGIFVPDNFEYVWLGQDGLDDDNTKRENAFKITNVTHE